MPVMRLPRWAMLEPWDETDEDWLEPDDQMGLWEYQLHPQWIG